MRHSRRRGVEAREYRPYVPLALHPQPHAAGAEYEASIRAADPDGDSLSYLWEIMRESEATQEGGDLEEVPETIAGLVRDPDSGSIRVTAPPGPGVYRLFAYAYDGRGKAGHANIPFYVE